jgi:peptidoglycan/xylan/chitin deacetylase (PgdA/CDA1 family)
LTFDDCYNAANLSAIIKILSDDNIKATFFPVGEAAAINHDLIKKAFDSGNHPYLHPYFTGLTYAQMQNEVNKADAVIKNITGQSTKPYFRPTYGVFNSSILQALGNFGYSKAICWTIDTRDYSGISSYSITQSVLNKA